MQKKQATGIDTPMMLPVYAAAFSIISLWLLPWISLPVMRYSRLPVKYSVFSTHACIDNLVKSIETGGKLAMEVPGPEQLEMLHRLAFYLQAAAAAAMVFMAVCIGIIFWKRSRSVRAIRILFSYQLLLSLGQAGLVLAANVLLNRCLGRPNSFLNLSVYSYVQLTSWVYGQILISLGICLGARKLMDVHAEAETQKYAQRTIRTDTAMGTRTKVTLLLIVLVIPLVIFFGIFFLNDRSNVFIGLCIICLAMIPFGMVFEDRRPQARELLLIAVISAIAVVGRTAFFMLPQFKPVTAIVIIAGIGLGAEAGFLTGAVSGFVSNFFFGQGPWTPWQMFAYGIIGFIAGLVFGRSCTSKIRSKRGQRLYLTAVCSYGALATFFIYGLIMDFSSAINFTREFSWEVLTAKLISGIPFNLVHSASTVVFLLFLARPFQKKLDRIKKKYGIMEV